MAKRAAETTGAVAGPEATQSPLTAIEPSSPVENAAGPPENVALTAENITDEQIRELKDAAGIRCTTRAAFQMLIVCELALNANPAHSADRLRARGICADALNAVNDGGEW